jgi:type I restriction enzyme M protein
MGEHDWQGKANLWGDLDPVIVATKPPEEKSEVVLEEGKITDIIDGERQVNDTPKEQVRQFIARALNEQYNIPFEAMEADFPVRINDGDKKRPLKIDIAIFHTTQKQKHIPSELSRAVICKPEPQQGKGAVRLRDPEEASKDLAELKAIMQTVESCEYGLWTNGLEFFYFTKEVGRFDIELVPLAAWPLAGESLKDASSRVVRIPAKTASRDMLRVAFRRCHNFIHGNEGMSKDAAFLQFLYLIFCKMHDEEQPFESRRFQIGLTEQFNKESYKSISQRIRDLFREVKAANPDIFRESDDITLGDRALAFIASELSRYDFSNSDIDAKGLAYQEIVGANMRGDRGQYFTPHGVVNLAAEILEPGPRERVFDPACGTGGFLREALKYRFRTFCEELGITPEQKETPEYLQAREQLKEYALRYVYGADFDPALVRASRMQMVMFGDGHGHLYHINSLEFPRGSLSGLVAARQEIPLGSVDVLMTNPPFGSDIPITEPTILEQYELARTWLRDGEGGFRMEERLKSNVAPEILFIERCLQWLREGGRMAIVLPDGILGNPADEYIRYWIMKNAWVLASIDLPIECLIVEAKVNILTSLLVLKKKTHEERIFEALHGPVEYPIFMAVAEKVGYDRRGNTLYKRTPDGEIQLFEVERRMRTIVRDGRAIEVPVPRYEPKIDNDLPLIIEKYREFRQRYPEPGA